MLAVSDGGFTDATLATGVMLDAWVHALRVTAGGVSGRLELETLALSAE